MANTLGKALYKYVLVWTGVIIIWSENVEGLIKHVEDIHIRLEKNGFWKFEELYLDELEVSSEVAVVFWRTALDKRKQIQAPRDRKYRRPW